LSFSRQSFVAGAVATTAAFYCEKQPLADMWDGEDAAVRETARKLELL